MGLKTALSASFKFYSKGDEFNGKYIFEKHLQKISKWF